MLSKTPLLYILKLLADKDWFRKFRSDDFDLKNKPKSGRPSNINNDICNAIESDPTLISRELANMFECDQTIIVDYLHKIEKSNRAGK